MATAVTVSEMLTQVKVVSGWTACLENKLDLALTSSALRVVKIPATQLAACKAANSPKETSLIRLCYWMFA
jgi:hypothetical protein